MKWNKLIGCAIFLMAFSDAVAQYSGSMKNIDRKNVIRYNLSGAMLFGVTKYYVFGYERLVKPNQSFSVNFGHVSLPKLLSINTGDFKIDKDLKRKGYNTSVDYRFYLQHENKFQAPHGLYVGPYYSFNHFIRDNQWTYRNDPANSYATTHTILNIHTVGFQLGYQFLLWDRFTVDLLMIGPGLGFYNLNTKVDSNIDAATKEQLYQAVQQLISQRFPGMNYVFADNQVDAGGVLRVTSVGYRYIIHIGYNF